jgi:hypothetical protein
VVNGKALWRLHYLARYLHALPGRERIRIVLNDFVRPLEHPQAFAGGRGIGRAAVVECLLLQE